MARSARPELSAMRRNYVFRRDNFTCQDCGWRPVNIPADWDARTHSAPHEVVGPPTRRSIYPRRRLLTIDHIVPLFHGGERLDYSNLQTLCSSCNSRKGTTPPIGFLLIEGVAV